MNSTISLKSTELFALDIQGIKTYKEYELNDNMTRDLEEPWSDNGVPYQLCDHICEPYHFKIGKTKWTTCRSDIEGFCNGGELTGMVQVRCMTYFQDHKWYDELTDEMLKEEALISFENFHELDYDVLVKLEECWWKENAHENAPFARRENHGEGPYANAKTKKDYDPYLDIKCIFSRSYGSNNADITQYNKKEYHDPSICNIRRFEMIKYSFDADEEYVAIKEHEYLDHSRTNIDACQAYQELFRIMDEGWLVTKAKDE
ncbi:hypothetical protein Tco_0269519 [Tanacetum coccineum]